jgi:hypothetical protein
MYALSMKFTQHASPSKKRANQPLFQGSRSQRLSNPSFSKKKNVKEIELSSLPRSNATVTTTTTTRVSYQNVRTTGYMSPPTVGI